jgi:hypothetical protein
MPTGRFDFYTFGSPRIGDSEFSDYLLSHFPSNGGYYRVTHLNDIVPHLPSASEGFTQAGDEVWYYDEKTRQSLKSAGPELV